MLTTLTKTTALRDALMSAPPILITTPMIQIKFVLESALMGCLLPTTLPECALQLASLG